MKDFNVKIKIMGKVSFGKGLISTYLDEISTHQEMVFFDTVNKHIYLSGDNYSDSSHIAFSGTHSVTGVTATNIQDCITQLEGVVSETVKYTEQTLTDAQKTQARTNIGATAPEVFIAIYGTTTQAQVQAAASAGKVVVCFYGNKMYMYAGESAAGYSQFTSVLYDTAYRVYLKNSTWGYASYDLPIDAVLYTTQNLSDSQKSVARTNIGAGTYSKPSDGIPASDLADGVIPTVEALTASEIQTIWDGVFGTQLISFTINDVAYQAEDGMTWYEWVSSAYNTDDFYSDPNPTTYPDGTYVRAQNGQTIDFSNVSEKSLNVIVNGRAYTYETDGGGLND